MIINELIDQIGGRERLEQIKKSASSDANETVIMVRALLAVLDAKPVGTVSIEPDWNSIPRRNIATVNMRPDLVMSEMRDGDNLYTIRPAASVPDVNFDPAKSGAEATIVTHFVAPEGYKLVPIEPSKEMLLASKRYKAKNKVPTGPGVYRAMVEAAPDPDGTI